jgi:Ser/Thr protein kinase RdoA (MazF antagonist)
LWPCPLSLAIRCRVRTWSARCPRALTFVSGTEYDFQREAQVREAARWLAHFHITCEGFGGRGATGETIPDVRRWWLDSEAELADLGSMFRGRGVEAELNYLRRWHSGLLRTWPLAKLDTLPPSWVHGDYHGRNLIFAGDHLAGLLDFDVVHRGFRIEDVALALFTFGRQYRQSVRIRPDTARAFLDEYARRVDLTRLERRALPMMASLVQARTAARYAVRLRDGEDIARTIRTHVARMRSLQSQVATLASAAAQER